MNEKLTALLEKLATQLGTTTQYLWKVLISQARVSGIKSLVYIVLVIVSGISLFLLHKKCCKTEEGFFSYDDNEGLIVMMIILAIIWVVMFFIGMDAMSNMLNALFNPEYWALKEVLDIL